MCTCTYIKIKRERGGESVYMYIHKDKERERGGESVYMYIHKDKERERRRECEQYILTEQ